MTIAAIVLGFAACNNEDVPEPQIGGNTYVGVRIAFPGTQSTRALPDDYNPNGTWKGRDAIETITVYVVNVTKGTVDYTTFGKTQFEGIDANGFLKPTLAVKATAGENIKAYAVVNDFNDKTGSVLKATGATDFDAKFKELEVAATAAEVAKSTIDGVTSAVTETVMMTNDAGAAEIASVAANVTEQQAKDGTNRADINVSRVASRGIVTIGTGVQATPINVTDANGTVVSTLTLKSVTYAIGQSNKKFFNMHKADWSTPEPVYSFIPSTATPWKEGATGGHTNFDYSDLASPKSLQPIANTNNANVVTALQTENFSKFILPVTHLDNNYRKGNTTYFEITCTFVPNEIDGVATTGTTQPQTVYLGMNDGKFYSTRGAATNANGQTATKYQDGVMKYILWLNPDKSYGGTEKITMSPTVRNQVYHAHISAFKAIGVPNNPINPDDPNVPDPEDPVNPIDPDDPLQTEDTYMSVSITVLPWTIHSYSVELDDNMY